jgi:hypothetical protein
VATYRGSNSLTANLATSLPSRIMKGLTSERSAAVLISGSQSGQLRCKRHVFGAGQALLQD